MSDQSIEDTIYKLWEDSGHGTRRIDIEKAFAAGAEAMRARCADLCYQLVDNSRETRFATAIREISLTPASTSSHTPA